MIENVIIRKGEAMKYVNLFVLLLLVTAGLSQAAITVVNGDFETGAPASGDVDDVAGWFDDTRTYRSAMHATRNDAFGAGGAFALMASSAADRLGDSGEHAYIYQNIATKDAGDAALQIDFEMGRPTDGSGTEDIAVIVSVYQSATYAGADGSSGYLPDAATDEVLIDSVIVHLPAHPADAGNAVAVQALLDISAANATDNLFLMLQTPPNGAAIQSGFYQVDNIAAVIPASLKAKNPTPANGKDGVAIDSFLVWEAPDDYVPTKYDVWFGTDPNEVTGGDMEKIVDGLNVLTVDPALHSLVSGDMDNDVTYYWYVDAYEPNGLDSIAHPGDLWSFTTIPSVPFFSEHPADQLVDAGSAPVFTVALTDVSGASYQWYKDDQMLADGDDFTGTATDTLTVLDAQAGDIGDYHCVATNSAGSTPSDTGRLTVRILVAHWSFEEGAGTAAVDSENAIGTVFNGDPNWIVDGQVGGAMSFDGDGDMLTLDGSGDANDIPVGNESYTISAWIRVSSTLNDKGIIGWGSYGDSRQVNAMKIDNGDDLFNYWWGDDYNADTDLENGLNEWHYVAATCDGTDRTLYYDGKSIGSDTVGVHEVPDLSNFAIGCTRPGIEFFPGDIDEVRIYNYALTDIQIAAEYTTDKPGASVCLGDVENDLDGDCRVNLADFAIMAGSWLDCNLYPESACSE